MNGQDDFNAPATKGDLAGVQMELTGLKDELKQLIERVETSLLTEFHKWASTYEIRARGTTRAVQEFEERLGVLEDRVSRLERERPQ